MSTNPFVAGTVIGYNVLEALRERRAREEGLFFDDNPRATRYRRLDPPEDRPFSLGQQRAVRQAVARVPDWAAAQARLASGRVWNAIGRNVRYARGPLATGAASWIRMSTSDLSSVLDNLRTYRAQTTATFAPLDTASSQPSRPIDTRILRVDSSTTVKKGQEVYPLIITDRATGRAFCYQQCSTAGEAEVACLDTEGEAMGVVVMDVSDVATAELAILAAGATREGIPGVESAMVAVLATRNASAAPPPEQ